jgi:hypothetical protein
MHCKMWWVYATQLRSKVAAWSSNLGPDPNSKLLNMIYIKDIMMALFESPWNNSPIQTSELVLLFTRLKVGRVCSPMLKVIDCPTNSRQIIDRDCSKYESAVMTLLDQRSKCKCMIHCIVTWQSVFLDKSSVCSVGSSPTRIFFLHSL